MELDVTGLRAALRAGETYLPRFDRQGYRDAFRAYVEEFGPRYMEAVRTAGESGLESLAAAILEEAAQDWQQLRFWKRNARQGQEKQMAVVYLSPMLLGLEEPLCRRLAELLRDEWTARWPKDGYQIAPYGYIQKGFRNTVMGIELPGSDREEPTDEIL